MSTGHTVVLLAGRDHGEPHEDNGKAGEIDAFYFFVQAPNYGLGRVSGYVTREQFNYLAKSLGLAPLPDEPVAEGK